MHAAAKFHAKSCDRKLAPVDLVDVGMARPRPIPRGPFVSSTYASIAATCPSTCPYKRKGCYVDGGFTKFAGQKLDQGARAKSKSGFEVILDEAELIDRAFPRGVPRDGARGGRDLRLHVAGDAPTEAAARLLATSARNWRRRGGGAVWTYTHAWRTVSRSAFGEISVLASCERHDELEQARARGYAPALVVREFPSGKRSFSAGGFTAIPCPAETLGKTCASCRLCLSADGLFARKQVIAFEVHGGGAAQASKALEPLVQLGRSAA